MDSAVIKYLIAVCVFPGACHLHNCLLIESGGFLNPNPIPFLISSVINLHGTQAGDFKEPRFCCDGQRRQFK